MRTIYLLACGNLAVPVVVSGAEQSWLHFNSLQLLAQCLQPQQRQ
jgi:hypothetical protein